MANVESYTKKDLRNVLREHERSLSEYENKIDVERSGMNYGYGHLTPDEAIQSINKRVTTVMNGKDVQSKTNICAEWVISCPLELMASGKEKEFFDECWKFSAERYGEDNMISGFVHMDETRPHMHMMFVPEAISRKTGRRTVSSASLLTKGELSGFHTDLDKHCESVFGQKKLVKTGKTIANGVSLKALKQIQANTRIQFADEIDSYRAFLSSYRSNGKTLLEVYEEKHKPVEIPVEAPQKPVEAPKPVLSHSSKTKGKIQPKKPQEPSKEQSYMDRKKEMLTGEQPSTEKRSDDWFDHIQELSEEELKAHGNSYYTIGLVADELMRRKAEKEKALADRRVSEANEMLSTPDSDTFGYTR